MNLSVIAQCLIAICVAVVFFALGSFVQGTELAMNAFASDRSLNLFVLLLLALVLGVLSGAVLPFERTYAQVFVHTLFSVGFFVWGMGSLAPYILPLTICIMYAIGYVLVMVVLQAIATIEYDPRPS